MGDQFVKVADKAELAGGTIKAVEINGQKLLSVRLVIIFMPLATYVPMPK